MNTKSKTINEIKVFFIMSLISGFFWLLARKDLNYIFLGFIGIAGFPISLSFLVFYIVRYFTTKE